MMDDKEKQKFGEHYATVPDETLLELLKGGEAGLVEGAYELVRNEATKRKLVNVDGNPILDAGKEIKSIVSDLATVNGAYNFCCISLLMFLLVCIIGVAIRVTIPKSNVAYVIMLFSFMFQCVFLSGIYGMAKQLKIHNMSKTSPWLWVIACFIPIVALIGMLRIVIRSKQLLKKLRTETDLPRESE
jgi:magnesium-transporting ATPase (P-type)